MTNTKAQHSPLPWGLKEEGSDEFWFGEGYLSLRQKDKSRYYGEICPISPSHKADAEFIVRAANNFEALVGTLTQIATAPQGAYSRNREQYLKNVITWCQETAQAAVVQAEKETP